MNVGVIGLDPLGRAIADRYLAVGNCPVFITARNGLPREMTVRGAYYCVSPHLVARRARLLFATSTDGASLNQALFGGDGLMRSLGPDQLVVTVGLPEADTSLSARINASGSAHLEVQASTGEGGAQAYTLRGRRDVFEAYEGWFAPLGPVVQFDGPVEAVARGKRPVTETRRIAMHRVSPPMRLSGALG